MPKLCSLGNLATVSEDKAKRMFLTMTRRLNETFTSLSWSNGTINWEGGTMSWMRLNYIPPVDVGPSAFPLERDPTSERISITNPENPDQWLEGTIEATIRQN